MLKNEVSIKFFNFINLFLEGIQVVQLRNDVTTNGCIAGGVECCDLTAHTVQRRLQTQGQLYLEKLYFVKHYDDE